MNIINRTGLICPSDWGKCCTVILILWVITNNIRSQLRNIFYWNIWRSSDFLGFKSSIGISTQSNVKGVLSEQIVKTHRRRLLMISVSRLDTRQRVFPIPAKNVIITYLGSVKNSFWVHTCFCAKIEGCNWKSKLMRSVCGKLMAVCTHVY